MSSEADYENVPIAGLTLTSPHADPMVQGAVAALVDVKLHMLDAVQGDQLCHLRTVLNADAARQIIEQLDDDGQLEDARKLTAEWWHLNAQKKIGDEAFLDEYTALVKTCSDVIGKRRMEIAKLCFDTTRDVTWVFTPMGISTYFRDQGQVQNKGEKQGLLQQRCIEEFEEIVASWCEKAPSSQYISQLQQALKLMRNRIEDGDENIPVLNFFIATLLVEHFDFMNGTIRALAVRRMEITEENDTVKLSKILTLYFRHNLKTGRLEPTQLTNGEKQLPLTFYQGWSKYHPGQTGSGVHSRFHEEHIEAVGQRFAELMARYSALHPTYADSVTYDREETKKSLEQVCGKSEGDDASVLANFSLHPGKNEMSLFDLWIQASKVETNLGAGEHKPLDTIKRGKIYKETTERTAFNIDHIFGANAAQSEEWAAFVMGRHERAGNPQLGCYSVVAGSATLPCKTEDEANIVADTKDKQRKKKFIKAHPELEPVIGMSWEIAFV
ncbi:hypothetical protein B0H13DRAFT_2353702 [Mycena leptocephala]|nr:hypothetical protein B0H13DRAFT_2353702 [Mycena leptocephala]